MANKIGKKTGIVFINGFTPNANDFEPLLPFLKRNRNVLVLSLPGDPNDIGSENFIPFEEWLENSYAAIARLRSICTKLYLIAFSIGSVPANYLASKVKFEKVVMISPVFDYATFDESTTSVVRMVRSTILSKGKTDPVNSVKTFRYLKDFAKSPVKNLGQLFRVRVGPLMNPSNILLFPIVALFEDELAAVDQAGSKLVKKIAYKKFQDFDFEADDMLFKPKKVEAPVAKLEPKKTTQLFNSVFNRVKQILPPEFTNLSSKSVYNMMRLLAYCNKFTEPNEAELRIYYAFYDPNVKKEGLQTILDRSSHFNKVLISYPTVEHNLFASPYYQEVARSVIHFLTDSE